MLAPPGRFRQRRDKLSVSGRLFPSRRPWALSLDGMTRKPNSETEGWMRLVIGIVLNACLWPLAAAISRWSSYDREARITLLAGGVAAAALAIVVPLFWRGRPWQAPIAFVLLWLPLLVLCGVFSRAIEML